MTPICLQIASSSNSTTQHALTRLRWPISLHTFTTELHVICYVSLPPFWSHPPDPPPPGTPPGPTSWTPEKLEYWLVMVVVRLGAPLPTKCSLVGRWVNAGRGSTIWWLTVLWRNSYTVLCSTGVMLKHHHKKRTESIRMRKQYTFREWMGWVGFVGLDVIVVVIVNYGDKVRANWMMTVYLAATESCHVADQIGRGLECAANISGLRWTRTNFE